MLQLLTGKMFQLINTSHQKKILNIAKKVEHFNMSLITNELYGLIELIRAEIPEKKKISYGRYTIIKQMGLKLYPILENLGVDVYDFALKLFENTGSDQFVRCLGIQLISIYGLELTNLKKVLSVFEKAATDKHWEMRECSAGFVRKLIKEHPAHMKKWYLTQAKSYNPDLRRFSSESIRPVADNIWFKNNPDFCFSVLENLYAEANPYPRTSVGNSLSDWARIDKEHVYRIITKLVKSRNKNSYWIAYRACRNLVKTEPIQVMNLLGVDEYVYKKRRYKRSDYQRN